jgi:acyl-coenzyme A synthetase/AMP-(fatty) acid ligase
MNMFAAWRSGASLHVLPATKVTDTVRFAREQRLTVWSSTPSLVALLARMKQLVPGALPEARLAVFIGEPLSRGTLAAWSAAAPNSVVEDLYGPTEATVVCTGQRIASDPVWTPGRDVLSIGTALSGCEAAIVSDEHEFLPAGQVGELALSGVQLAQGYLGAPELTEARFPVIDGKRWYLTGDSAYRDGDGRFHHLGRIDNQVKVLGNRVELEEVEAHIRDVTAHELVAVLPWPTIDGMHQGLVAFVCGARLETLMSALRLRVPAFMLPSRIHWVDQMPVNPSGKIDRQALAQRLRRGGV